jgi:hypothetical protein
MVRPRDPLSDAVALVARFRADMLDETVPLPELAVKWGVSDSNLRRLARELGIPPRQRGKKAADALVPSSPRTLAGGQWVGHAGVRRWVE